MKIFWTDFAKNELHEIFTYYRENASLKVARNLVLGITHEVLKLQKGTQHWTERRSSY